MPTFRAIRRMSYWPEIVLCIAIQVAATAATKLTLATTATTPTIAILSQHRGGFLPGRGAWQEVIVAKVLELSSGLS